MNVNEKGFIAETKVILRATELGYMVSRPLRDDCRYDLILDKDGKLKRVQVKYAGSKPCKSKGAIPVVLTKNNKKKGAEYKERKYSADEVDAIVAYFPDYDKLCWFDTKTIEDMTAIQIRFEPTANRQNKRTRMAKDFAW